MKPESLHALFIDRQLGELSPEAAELLDAWLTEHPETATEAHSIERAMATASAAVRRFPELARPNSNVIPFPLHGFRLVPVALAASILLLVGSTAWISFRAGRDSALSATAPKQSDPAPILAVEKPAKETGPWARYALASGSGGLTVVRRDQN